MVGRHKLARQNDRRALRRTNYVGLRVRGAGAGNLRVVRRGARRGRGTGGKRVRLLLFEAAALYHGSVHMRVDVARILGMTRKGLAAVLDGAGLPRTGRLLDMGFFGIHGGVELGSADLFEGDGGGLRAFVPFFGGARMDA